MLAELQLLEKNKTKLYYYYYYQATKGPFIPCVFLNLPTVDLKLALTAETKSWMVDFGHHCNRKYHMEMEQIFTFIDEASKKLNRQIKDLDDIRIAMATLKEIREHQISIDFQVGPIEVHTNKQKNST